MRREVVLIDFSGVYREENFWKEENVKWIPAQDIPGTNCYCDDEAWKLLQERMEEFSPEGIHFLDSGNYHYMTRLWMEKIRKPFQLLVFDNHTDMQLPAFGGILSCGGWIVHALEKQPYLKKVFLVGPPQKDWEEVEVSLREKTEFFGREMMRKAYKEGERSRIRQYVEKLSPSFPLYISVDRDILCEEEACTGWSQGETKEEELFDFLEELFCYIKENRIPLLGIDVCGEGEPADWFGLSLNDKGNGRILKFLTEKGVFDEE